MLNLVCEKIAVLDLPSYVKDSELRYVVVNEAFAALFDLDPMSFVGRSDTELLGTRLDSLRDDTERRVLVFGEDEQLGYRARPDEPVRMLRIERFYGEDDQLYLFGFMDAPQSAELSGGYSVPWSAEMEVFRTVLDRLPVAAFVRDNEHRLVFANQAYADLAECPLEDLLGKTELEMFPLAGQIYHDDNRRILDGGLAEEVRDIFVRPNGSRVPTLCRMGAIETRDGSRYLIGTMTDLSPLRQGEEKLAAARREADNMRNYFQTLLLSLPVGIMLLGPDLLIEYVNTALVDMAEFGPEVELLGMSYSEFLERVTWRSEPHLAAEEVRSRIAFRVEQLLSLDDGPLIDAKTPSGRALAAGSRKLEGGRILVTYSDVSDMVQREEETLLYRAALEQMQVPVFIRDIDRRLIYVNGAYEELHQQRREDIYGMTEAEMWPERGQQLTEENIRCLEHGEVIERPSDVVIRDGEEISVITRINRITTAQHKHFLVGSVTDVSVIKRGQEAVREAQARAEALYQDLVAMLHIMPVGVVILNADYMVEFANEKCREIWNWPEDLPLAGLSFRSYCERNHSQGKTWPGLEFEEGYRRRIAQFDALEGSQTTELSYDDGQHVLATITRLRDRKILMTYSDLTEMRKREKEIDEAQEQLERLGQLMQDTMRLTSQGLVAIERGRIAEINPAFIRILDLPEDLAAIGSRWRDIFSYCAERGDFGTEGQAILSQWQAAMKETTGVSTTFMAGAKTWVKLEATFGGSGSCVVVLTDITELKVREAELEVLLARSEAADKAKSDFLANMSHEIRTPMNGVLGMAELLSKSTLDSRQKTFVDIIMKSGNALLTIINDILDFSKIDAGQLKLRNSPFDPVEAIEDVATLLSAAAAEKDIELVISGDQAVDHTFLGDPGRFRQIVTNLLGNAIKFTEKGHVHIDLSSEPLGDGKARLIVSISDTGVGIAPEMQAQIFEKFSQVDTSSTRRHEGTGLGLAITAGLIKLFGGQLNVRSQLGKGSVFTVEMPLKVVAERRRQKELPANVKDARVLVIDDNAVNRQILGEQLSMWGFDGHAVESGRLGLQILDEAHRAGITVDAVIIDYHMPEMNGTDVARIIRNDRRFDDMPLIFLTSMDMAGSEQLFESLRVQAHLMKPARANVLRGAIIDVIRTTRLGAGRPLVAPPLELQPQIECPVGNAAEAMSVQMPAEDVRILIAEDNEVNQIVFNQILAGSGIRYRIVGNGQLAVDAWRTHKPDLILMDVSMPVLNGHEACRAIRSEEMLHGLGEHVPIVGVTAHALDSDREACIAAGMDDYLSKPISPETLMRKIGEWYALEPGQIAGGLGA
ncbi:PAS domain-containing protein [Rhizobium sp. G187]|uniref:PAS domain-containing protein n=1 Tax=Rhizobium sp. G187 TaxID=3451352 RepID=UPI003EE8081F